MASTSHSVSPSISTGGGGGVILPVEVGRLECQRVPQSQMVLHIQSHDESDGQLHDQGHEEPQDQDPDPYSEWAIPPGTPEWWNRVAARAVAAARPTQPMTLEHLFHAYDETQEPSDIGDPDYLEDPDESPDEFESEFEPGLMTITDEPGRGAPAA
ncbi:hypothetical protein B0O80DRAFT_526401 [Mortierella sp. GBAus27b]|nr:hypothetical protein B0O80DRAFT_526401 [Mortierella sp. GBAus27b]